MPAPAVPSVMLTVTELVNVPPLGEITGVATNPAAFPYTDKAYWQPTYTFPLATTGTVNFTAPAAASLVPAWLLLYNSCPTFSALYACKIAGCPLPQPSDWIAHTMPLLVPLADTLGVAPGNPYVVGPCDVGLALTAALPMLNAFIRSPDPM